jgi:hypothetical protein
MAAPTEASMSTLTYPNKKEERRDKVQMERLRVALNAAQTSLRLDECRLWTLQGSRGYASTWGDGETWHLITGARSKRTWSALKHRLAFSELTQDGDDEGCFRLHQLPTPKQAEIIRDVLGLRQPGPVTNRERVSPAVGGVSAPRTAAD